ncbi:tripartite tricarboxylate transporter substrate binding protein [Acuticoccus sp. M5D2P5]|uniref:Bug family tripartite tricarboxylate transporter substrate binding protein n=1 Tax=Acuticoccus kalidii TaxID=2910977 RepID=UPI001F307D17|nr:tripartite tricarboxylate transporter substrate binding protein [Acuticoccus kalidii]MCF3935361.1 tripartite tricarboxylate transporter substrate binding protein [Acuticoccus kalidii]
MRKTIAALAFAGALPLMAGGAALAQDFPSKDVRVVVPWGAGGGTDAIVRKITTLAEGELGGTMYVENVEGGASATGIMEVMNAAPDGYTVGALTYDSVVTVPRQGLLKSYSLDKLAPIARITSEPDALMVSKNAPFQTFDEMIAAAKEQPGGVRVGIQNIGSRTHLAMLQLQKLTDTEFDLIAYPGGAAPQKEAVLSGEVDAVVTSLGDFAPLIQSGDVKGVIEFSTDRNPTYPDVPTTAEKGVDFQIGSFILLAVPAGTPDAVVTKLTDAYQAAYDSEAFQSWVSTIGVTPSWLAGAEAQSWMTSTQAELFQLMDEIEGK